MQQAGFTLFELMIAIAVIAILTAIGVPGYQSYMQKAALTDMLQSALPYRQGVELCLLETGQLNQCRSGSYAIPATKSSRYIKKITVINGVITLEGDGTLTGLTANLTPTLSSDNQLEWQGVCRCQPENINLVKACNHVFQFSVGE